MFVWRAEASNPGHVWTFLQQQCICMCVWISMYVCVTMYVSETERRGGRVCGYRDGTGWTESHVFCGRSFLGALSQSSSHPTHFCFVFWDPSGNPSSSLYNSVPTCSWSLGSRFFGLLDLCLFWSFRKTRFPCFSWSFISNPSLWFCYWSLEEHLLCGGYMDPEGLSPCAQAAVVSQLAHGRSDCPDPWALSGDLDTTARDWWGPREVCRVMKRQVGFGVES